MPLLTALSLTLFVSLLLQAKADLSFHELIAGEIQDTPESCTVNLSADHQDWLTRFLDAAERQGAKAILEPGQGVYF